MDEEWWTVQYDNATQWEGIALYSTDGDPCNLTVASRPPVRKTAAGERCSYIVGDLLPQFRANWFRVVFYRLRAGTQIAEHRDLGTNRRILGITRIHVPVVTDDDVLMFVGGKRHHFALGTVWYFDASARHSVHNRSSRDRVHLVIDFETCGALDALLKPDTVRDRVRNSALGVIHKWRLGPMFCALEKSVRYMGSGGGRARIYARMRHRIMRGGKAG
jgi:hypothetical protein